MLLLLAAPVPAQVQPLDRAQAEAERMNAAQPGAAPAYVDKVMTPDQAALPADEGEPADTRGFRAWAVETRLGAARSDDGLVLRSAREMGQQAQYRHHTLNYGAFEVELSHRSGPGPGEVGLGSMASAGQSSSRRLTLRNLGLPVTPRLSADTAIGDFYSEITPALARTYRLSLGSSAVRGMSARLNGERFEVQAGSGQRGVFTGSPYAGFEPTSGHLAWAGASLRWSQRWAAGVQFNRASGIRPYAWSGRASPAPGEDVASVAAGLSWNGEDNARLERVRVMHVRSRGSGSAGSGQGWFVEGAAAFAGLRHVFGTWAAGENLLFGDALLASANRGAYWRMDSSSSRLSWGLGLDAERQGAAPGAGTTASRRLGMHGSGHYPLGRWDLLGGHFQFGQVRQASEAEGTSQSGEVHRSMSGSAWYQTRFSGWGVSRVRGSFFRNTRLVANEPAATGETLEFDQEWLAAGGDVLNRPELVTSAGIARDRSGTGTERRPTAGLTFRLWPAAGWHASGSLRYTARQSRLSTTRGLAGTLLAERRLAQRWRVGAAIHLNQARLQVLRQPTMGLDETALFRTEDRSAWIYLRWEGAAGSMAQAAGWREPGLAGAGAVAGIVFQDADRDGRQQSGETGVAGVEVVLDGRFRTVTDRHGRFDFPLVPTGRHLLNLTPETVPLPWGPEGVREHRIEVPLRGEAFLRIPVVRVGD